MENKRRNLSGIYIFDKFPEDERRFPTCIEDCQEETRKKWLQVFLRRFFSQQFKRSCLPDGPKVGSVSLSPRGDWRMPSDASSESWLAELDNDNNHETVEDK